MNDNTRIKTPQEAFVKTRDYFLGNSLKPAENVPDGVAVIAAPDLREIRQHSGVKASAAARAALKQDTGMRW